MRKIIYRLTLIWGSFFAGLTPTFAQDGAGTSTADNSFVTIAAGSVEQRFSETSYFGPNAEWEINGTLEIWSKKIWISPNAKFKGTGKIIIHNPGSNPYYTTMGNSPTEIDGNNSAFILPAIVLQNPHNIILTNIADPGYGSTNPSGALSAALNIGGRFEFNIDGGDVILNGNNFGLSDAGQLVGYNSNRMIVTGNNLEGHVIKNYSTTSPFLFPIGIAEGDYTPASITPIKSVSIYATVLDYTNAPIGQLSSSRGMNRTWQIYANESLAITGQLYHNSATNNALFGDSNAEIMQYTGSDTWSKGITSVNGIGIHERANILVSNNPLDETTWFTKLNVINGPIAANDNIIGIVETNILVNDKLAAGTVATPTAVTVDLNLNISGTQTELVVANEGTWRYNSATGTILFVPLPGFQTNPTPISYRLTEISSGLFSDAIITIQIAPRLAIGIAKKLTDLHRELNGSQTASFTFTVKNYGNTSLDNVSVIDNLREAFPNPMDISVRSVQATGTLRANANYNGKDNLDLLATGSTLDIGKTETVKLVVNVLHNGTFGTFYNYAVARGTGRNIGGTTMDESTDGLVPDLNNNNSADDVGENIKTPIILSGADVKIPEGFSPNGDGINDKFIIENAGNAKIDLEIYNRWGNIVYKNPNYKNEWDGTVNTGIYLGQNVPDGTYYYIVKIDGVLKPVKFITVNR